MLVAGNGQHAPASDPRLQTAGCIGRAHRPEERKVATLGLDAMKRFVATTLDSPVGRLRLVATDLGLSAVLWENDHPRRVPLTIDDDDASHPVLVEASRQLEEYFAGARREFALGLDVQGTVFQRHVWAALATIPFGETRSYRDIAEQIGNRAAVRAVGAANGRNPVSIIVPCHRVIGAAGQLTGFAGGLDVKARLLAFEGSRTGAFSLRP